MSNELKDCPFCGSDEVSVHHDAEQDAYWIACTCNATMTALENDDDKHVKAAWNRRAPASTAAVSGELVFPLSLLEEIAQKRAESIPGPGGYPCSNSEIQAFKKAFLKEWMPRAIAHQPPKAAQYLNQVADFLADSVGGYSGGLIDRIEEVIKQLRADAGCGACGDACPGMTCRLQEESPVAIIAPKEALTNDRILEMRDSVWCAVAGDDEYDAADLAFARAIEAATVPKAKLEALELLSKFWLGRYFDSVNQSEADGINAALASAGVPLKGE